jgi:hypothetical protein
MIIYYGFMTNLLQKCQTMSCSKNYLHICFIWTVQTVYWQRSHQVVYTVIHMYRIPFQKLNFYEVVYYHIEHRLLCLVILYVMPNMVKIATRNLYKVCCVTCSLGQYMSFDSMNWLCDICWLPVIFTNFLNCFHILKCICD